MIVSLPTPPSLNNAFATIRVGNKTRRVKTADYAAWQTAAVQHLRLVAGKPLEAPYGVHIRIDINNQSDIDNRIKAVLDALVGARIIKGDQWVNTVRIDRDRAIQGCQVEVWSIGGAS